MKNTAHTIAKVAFLMATAIAATACQHTALSGPTATETTLRNEVKLVRLPFRVAAEEDGTATPSRYTLNGINLFLSSVNAGHGDVILLDGPDVHDSRIAAIADHLHQSGLTYGGKSALGVTPENGDITLYVERHVVTPPNCGIWYSESSDNAQNNPSRHHGCATVSNLGLMVANPRDLIAGEAGGNSTAAAVGAIYGGPQANAGPSVTLSLEGLADIPNTLSPAEAARATRSRPGNQ